MPGQSQTPNALPLHPGAGWIAVGESAPLRRSWLLQAVVLALCALWLLSAAGCRTKRPTDNMNDPAVVYERAKKVMNSQDYSSAVKIYEALVARYPFAAESRQARLDLIYAYYRARESESAIDACDTFIRENPTHPRVDYAWYIKGMVDFERTPNVLEKFFKVDLNQRPPQTARKAFTAFRKVVEDFPKSEYAHDARRRMIHLRNRLADYELYVARYYVRRGAWVAAAQRSRAVVEQYDGAPAVREALEIMVDSYEKLGMKEQADRTRQVYAANFGGDEKTVVPTKRRWWKFWG
jgi:outer membrane protein assembly factor BamD